MIVEPLTEVTPERDACVPVRVATGERRPLVYLAGPYSSPDPVHNTHRTIRVADALLAAGFVPLIPHLTLAWHLVSPKRYDTLLDYDGELLERCDAVLRIPGRSPGADGEAQHAESLGIPVIQPRSGNPSDCVAAVVNALSEEGGRR